ncbi:MAG: hypothetical protein EOP82_14610 [Variovorax sp.]|nr:MAG: hypothetical protein EOP82_14610 [Variovorax sp.]
MTKHTPKASPDWEVIELDYRAGIKTLRQIADAHELTEGAIRKRAKRDEWARDLSGRIQAKAEALVRKEVVRNEVRAEASISERQVIEANAKAVADIRLSHRRDIHRSRTILARLMDELELQVGFENVDVLEQLGDLMRREDENGQDRRNDLYRKIISLPSRAKTMKDMGETLRALIGLERQAFGLDGAENDPDAPGAQAR